MSLTLALLNFLIPLFLIMFFVFLYFHSISCLSVNLLKDCLCVLCFYFNIVSFRTFHVGRRLEWVKSIMVCICYRRVLLGPPYLLDHLSIHKSFKSTFSSSVSTKDMPILWHFRLGHPSLSRMSILQNVLPSFSAQCIDVCTICPLAKRKRLPFPSHNNLCNEPFSLIHVDVWGPYSICTHDGFKFFLTIVDNATRST